MLSGDRCHSAEVTLHLRSSFRSGWQNVKGDTGNTASVCSDMNLSLGYRVITKTSSDVQQLACLFLCTFRVMSVDGSHPKAWFV